MANYLIGHIRNTSSEYDLLACCCQLIRAVGIRNSEIRGRTEVSNDFRCIQVIHETAVCSGWAVQEKR